MPTTQSNTQRVPNPLTLPRRASRVAPSTPAYDGYVPSRHCAIQAARKGISLQAVLQAANAPTVRYESHQRPGIWRHCREGIVAICDPRTRTIITVHADQVQTPLRPDQTDAAALRYAARCNGH